MKNNGMSWEESERLWKERRDRDFLFINFYKLETVIEE
jgi:hypothetical protein